MSEYEYFECYYCKQNCKFYVNESQSGTKYYRCSKCKRIVKNPCRTTTFKPKYIDYRPIKQKEEIIYWEL